MKPLYQFIIEPKDGALYNSESNGLVLSTSYENHKFTQRIAIVVETPMKYKGPIKKGNYVVVHHNIFRKSFDMQGGLSNSSDFLGEGKYFADESKMYMTSLDSKSWKALPPFMFVSPIENDETLVSASPFKKEHGCVEYSSDHSIKAGEVVRFTPASEYEFMINGQLLYRMKKNDLVWKVS